MDEIMKHLPIGMLTNVFYAQLSNISEFIVSQEQDALECIRMEKFDSCDDVDVDWAELTSVIFGWTSFLPEIVQKPINDTVKPRLRHELVNHCNSQSDWLSQGADKRPNNSRSRGFSESLDNRKEEIGMSIISFLVSFQQFNTNFGSYGMANQVQIHTFWNIFLNEFNFVIQLSFNSENLWTIYEKIKQKL